MITTNEIGRRLTTSNCCQVKLNENDVLFCHHCCCLGGTGSCDHYGAQLVGNRIFQRLIRQNVPIFESLLLVAAVSKVRNGDGGGGVGVSKRRTAILMKRRKLRRQQVYLAKSIIEGMKKTCGTRFFHYIHHHHQSSKKEMCSAVTTTNTTITKEEATFVEMTNDEMIQITLHSLLSSVVDVVTML